MKSLNEETYKNIIRALLMSTKIMTRVKFLNFHYNIGSTSGQCNNRVSGQFNRYCGYYLGITSLSVSNQPICGKVYFVFHLLNLHFK